MCVIEARHDEMSFEIDNLRLISFKPLEIERLAHSQNAVSFHRDGFCAKDGTERSVIRDTGIDVGVDKNYVGLDFGLRGGDAGLPHTHRATTKQGRSDP